MDSVDLQVIRTARDWVGAGHRVVLATSEKLGQRVPHRIADMRDISIYVEHDADESQLQSLALAGAHVTKVPHAD